MRGCALHSLKILETDLNSNSMDFQHFAHYGQAQLSFAFQAVLAVCFFGQLYLSIYIYLYFNLWHFWIKTYQLVHCVPMKQHLFGTPCCTFLCHLHCTGCFKLGGQTSKSRLPESLMMSETSMSVGLWPHRLIAACQG